MKKILINILTLAILYIVIFVVIDALANELHPLYEYAWKGTLFSAIVILVSYLNEHGWNSWEKVFGIFKKRNERDKK